MKPNPPPSVQMQLLKIYFILSHVYGFVFLCVYVRMNAGAYGQRLEVLGLLKLGSQGVMSQYMGAWK